MIDGVIQKELVTHKDDRGFFREIFRFSDETPSIPVGQLSHSCVNEGVVKGWHGHHYQSQWNYVVIGKISVVLYDNRPNSQSYQEQMHFHVGENSDTKAYFFPPGVQHGYQCKKGPMQIIYVTSGVYDLDDELRFPLNAFNIQHDWSL